MDLGLKGLRALVTGGTRGIGRAVVETLAAEGAAVAFCARTPDDVDGAAAALAGNGGTVLGYAADVGDEPSLRQWVTDAAAALGGIDIVVANVSALAIPDSPENWRRSFDVDMMGTVGLVGAAMPYLERSRAASIVTISSVSAREIDFAAGPYGTFKAAIVHYTQGLAYQLAGKGIRANSLSPGNTFFAGGVWDMIQRENPELYGEALALNPTGRMAKPEEIARCVAFLASPAASFMTGANLLVDGALTRGVQFLSRFDPGPAGIRPADSVSVVIFEHEGYQLDDDASRIEPGAAWDFLSTEAYWGRERTRGDFEAQLKSAWRVVGVYEAATGRMVGFARAFSDGVATAYLADVYVLSAARGHGLGKELVRTMIDRGPGADFRWMLHTKDAHGLYRQFGFAEPDDRYLERPKRALAGTTASTHHGLSRTTASAAQRPQPHHGTDPASAIPREPADAGPHHPASPPAAPPKSTNVASGSRCPGGPAARVSRREGVCGWRGRWFAGIVGYARLGGGSAAALRSAAAAAAGFLRRLCAQIVQKISAWARLSSSRPGRIPGRVWCLFPGPRGPAGNDPL